MIRSTGKLRTLFGCVTDRSPKYLTQALRLVTSIRWMAGKYASADILVCAVGGMPAEYRAEFERFDAAVVAVDRYDRRHAPSNKLRFLDQVKPDRYDRIVLTDCDVVFVRDPQQGLSVGGLRAKIADLATLSQSALENIFALFDRPFPAPEYTTTIDLKPTIAYCNSGVIACSGDLWPALSECWERYNRIIVDNPGLLAPYSFFSDQASFCLVVDELRDQFSFFGPEMNLPTHFALEQIPPAVTEIDPVVIHYHSQTEPVWGLIKPCGMAAPDRRISAFNQKYFAYVTKTLPRGLLANYRHVAAPSGHCFPAAPFATGLLRSLCAAHRPASILDLGCRVPAAAEWVGRGRYDAVSNARYRAEVAALDLGDGVSFAPDFTALAERRAELVLVGDLNEWLGDGVDIDQVADSLVAMSERFLLVGIDKAPFGNHPLSAQQVTAALTRAGCDQVTRYAEAGSEYLLATVS